MTGSDKWHCALPPFYATTTVNAALPPTRCRHQSTGAVDTPNANSDEVQENTRVKSGLESADNDTGI